ncbi:SDR family oxidoreductase [Pseudomonas aeruginosa]|uniref:SDR family oxidoreductase n=1 Tax=Pseudomonas TaxID=286 RepID=UPI001C1040E8|nr:MULTISPECIES: SDR family oxidoreductase [Pseudomonas]ELQ8316739.1 SDR family oxidoreductase [Pseudomonas aeruginosa]MBU5733053.1 SDR family oxidoreductase [Pseudomonas aeruginosa]MBU5754972.1 SDR family oxidoreductase [Pseudomonas aeruginosa]UUJ38929.1 SDR family oxidoreductase [Pseudomonas extremaustralis]HDQ4471763.1 SDR family oxidoreductase [Pseudomonas aeruginosa]
MNTTSKIALVTGASRGIGAAITRRLVRDGFAVAINYAASSAEADALALEIQQQGGQAIAVKADVSNAEQVRALFDTVEQALGKVDVLVNNAGVLKTAALLQTSDELFAQQFSINTQGVFNTLREGGARLNDGGRIINLSSTTLALNLPGYAIYNGTKAAVEAFTRVFAKELRGRGISVNAVAPGPVATELFLNGKTEEQIQTFAKMSPLERLGQPEDIAGVVAFLASAEGAWVNGQVLRANGGLG